MDVLLVRWLQAHPDIRVAFNGTETEWMLRTEGAFLLRIKAEAWAAHVGARRGFPGRGDAGHLTEERHPDGVADNSWRHAANGGAEKVERATSRQPFLTTSYLTGLRSPSFRWQLPGAVPGEFGSKACLNGREVNS